MKKKEKKLNGYFAFRCNKDVLKEVKKLSHKHEVDLAYYFRHELKKLNDELKRGV